jgi:magnesium chelatase subunit I
VYEGEQEGAAEVAALLIEAAARSMFEQQFPRVEKLERPGATGPYTALLEWFGENELRMPDEAADEVYRQQLDQVKPLNDLLKKYQPDVAATDRYFMMELILWGLAAARKLSKQRLTEEMRFSEPISGFER